MGPKKRQRTGDTTLDMDNNLNWSKVKLRHELSLVGLVTSPTFTLSTLRNLYVDNVLNRSRNNFSSQTTNSVPMLRRQSRIPRPTNSTGPTSDTIRVDTVQSRLTANSSPEESTVRDYNNVPYVTVRDDHEQRGDSVSARNDITDNTTSGSSGPGNNMAANITSPTVIQALVDTMTGMQAVMTKLINNEDKQKSLPTLADVYSARHDSFASREQQTRRSYGVSPEDIPHMDLMAPSLRRQIIEDEQVSSAGAYSSSNPMYLPPSLRSNVEFQESSQQLVSNSVSQNTRKVYDTGFRWYERYCAMNNVVFNSILPPISEQMLIYFVTYCHKFLKVKYTTIKLYLCGIRFTYLSKGVPSPFYATDSNFDIGRTGVLPRLQMALNGIKRTDLCSSRRPRYPITFSVLSQICNRFQSGLFCGEIDKTMRTVCIIAFFGFMRCGEFSCNSTFDPNVNVTVGDVTVSKDVTVLRLKQSKTDPFRHGVNIKFFCNNTTICPKCALDLYVEQRLHVHQASPTQPLFVQEGHKPLTRNNFIEKLRSSLNACGLPQDLYNGHSFRIGAATTAASNRMEDHLIKTMGRWTSESYCRYIHTSDSIIKTAQFSMTNS
ncbi:uncharacterized protein [Argopecten irradians]|uniref:uncharacterized protein n=1 Tax=Argopecten irradians TaxID=31199 RepID=UPI00371F439D